MSGGPSTLTASGRRASPRRIAATSAGASGIRISEATLAGQAGPRESSFLRASRSANVAPSVASVATVPCRLTSASNRRWPSRSTSMFTVARTRSPPSQLVARTRALIRATACWRPARAAVKASGVGAGYGRATGGACTQPITKAPSTNAPTANRQSANRRSAKPGRMKPRPATARSGSPFSRGDHHLPATDLHLPAALLASSVRRRSPSSRATRSLGDSESARL